MYTLNEKSFRLGNLQDLTYFDPPMDDGRRTGLSLFRGSFPSERYGHRDTRYVLAIRAGERPLGEYRIMSADEIKALHKLLGEVIQAGEVVDELDESTYQKCCDEKSRRDWVNEHRNGFSVQYC